MASGPVVGGDDEAKEKQRFGERKVYTRRKVLKGQKKDPNAPNTVASTTENNATTTSTVTNDSINNRTVQKSKVGESGAAKSNSENVVVQPPEQSAMEKGAAQPQVSSRLEDGILGQNPLEDQMQVSLRLENGNTVQTAVEDQDMTVIEGSSRKEDENITQPQLEDENMVLSNGNLRLEDGNMAQPQANSRLEDANMSQIQEVGNMAQPQVSSKSEDGSAALPHMGSRSEDGNTAQPGVSLDGNMAQPQLSSRLEDGNIAQLQVSPRSEDVNMVQPQESSKLEGKKSPQPEVNSRMEDGNSPQLQVNSRLVVGVLPLSHVNSRWDGDTVQPPVVLVSDDSYNRQRDEPSSVNVEQDNDGPLSPSPHQEAVPSTRSIPLGNGVVEPRQRDRIKISLSSKSKQQIREIRWKLESELDVVRSLVNRIEVKQRQVGGYRNSNVLVASGMDNVGGAKRAHSEVASVGVPREPASSRPLHQLSLSMLENSQGIGETVEKEKRTPKANQFYRNSEFLLAKDKFPPAESNKKSKLNWKKQGGGEMRHGFGMGSKFFKSCSSLLEKLMKHKHGWVFNAPVDVEGLGLHDYFTIITHPMDLGTVKSRLNKNWYKSPKEFAEDVRLTFNNAMTYNPKGQDVHIMAEQLAKIFEDRWAIIESDYNREMRCGFDYGAAPPAPSPLSRRVSAFTPPPHLDMRRILDRSESMTQTPKPMSFTPSSRTPAPKKPKAKDPYKRDMTFEEKQKLSTNLQSLPSEKLDAIVQIIKKRNLALDQHDDEIEVDIDNVDAETLWELDRFVTNYKKSLSKNKRKAELARARAEALQQNAIQKSQAPAIEEIPKEIQTDERNVPQSLPVQGGNQADNGSRSSSSSSSSSDSGSSSSDSDSDSSSASGSDAGSQGT
ncbi:transcription factor GTE4 [Vigna radiata var. radiata]|uniref:Transcription factor GTE4 n=1 Tax=Vigna radiata var. radiata TaxID=3916 RepID=A0A1S3W2N0_VIGRR|nr:transcription factor GTE4 [Vigna radiata var. radiata]